MPGQAAKVIISERQQGVLKSMAQSRSCPQGLAYRDRIVLLALEGLTNGPIAGRLGCERHGVGIWRRRWREAFEQLVVIECTEKPSALRQAVSKALDDLPRAGCGGTFTAERITRTLAVLQCPATRLCLPPFTAERITRTLAVACEPPDKSGRPVSHSTPRELTDEVIQRGIVPSISVRQVGRFFKDGRTPTAPEPVPAERQAGGSGRVRGAGS